MSNSVNTLFVDSFTVGVHSSRPGSICNLPPFNESQSHSYSETLLYCAGQELRTINIDLSKDTKEKISHSKFSSKNHTGCVAAITCNKTHVLSCDYDGEIKLWNTGSGDLLSTADVSTIAPSQVPCQQQEYPSSSSSSVTHETHLSSLKTECLSLTTPCSKYAAVAAEGIFVLFIFAIEGNQLVLKSKLSCCVQFVHFNMSTEPSDEFSNDKISFTLVRRNLPVDVAKGLTTSSDNLNQFGYCIESRQLVDGGVTSLLLKRHVLQYEERILSICVEKYLIAFVYRSIRRLALFDTRNNGKIIGSFNWTNLGSSSPVLLDNNLELVIFPGVLLQVDIYEIFEEATFTDGKRDVPAEFTLSLPTKAEIRSSSPGFDWKCLEREGIKFVKVPEAVTDYYVAMFHSKSDVFVIFTAFEIITADAHQNNQFFNLLEDVKDRRCLFNITCIGCACNGKYVAAGDFSGQVVVCESEVADKMSPNVDNALSGTEDCNQTIHSMYYTNESVRSLTWHPSYEEVLFMGLFSSTIACVDIQSRVVVPVVIDELSSGAITCLKWSPIFFPTPPPSNLANTCYMGVVDTAFEDICVPASAILLASTTTGHVTLYRHDFCYNRAEIGALREEKIQLIPDLFVKSFVKLTTFLAHHPLESNDNFGSLGHFAEVWSCAWSPLGQPLSPQHFVTCSEDQQVRVWSLNIETSAAQLDNSLPNAQTESQDCLRHDESNQLTDEDKPVSSPVFVLTGHRFAVTCLDWQLLSDQMTSTHASSDSTQFSTATDPSNLSALQQLTPSAENPTILVTSFMASCSDDKSIRIYRVQEYLFTCGSDVATNDSECIEASQNLKVSSRDIDFKLVILLSTSFLPDWHTLTYSCFQTKGSLLAVVTQHGFLLLFSLIDAPVVMDASEEQVWEILKRPDCCVFCRKVANGSLEGLSWFDNKLCASSADCCLNVKIVK